MMKGKVAKQLMSILKMMKIEEYNEKYYEGTYVNPFISSHSYFVRNCSFKQYLVNVLVNKRIKDHYDFFFKLPKHSRLLYQSKHNPIKIFKNVTIDSNKLKDLVETFYPINKIEIKNVNLYPYY